MSATRVIINKTNRFPTLNMKTFALAALAAAASAATSDHWAVIMAGSNTYSNYRH